MAYNGVSEEYLLPKVKQFVSVKKQSGFSLIELLVIIVIIGVIAAIGTPQLLGMRIRSSVRSDARDVHSALRRTQTEAVKASTEACLIIDDTARTYQIQIADYFGTFNTGKSTDLPIKTLRSGNSIDSSDLDDTPCFNRRGLPNEDGDGTILLTNTALTMEVTLSPSGHVSSTNQ